jgi:hypothetical protein
MPGNYSGPATIDQDGAVIDVHCDYYVSFSPSLGSDGPSGLESWEGTFVVRSGGYGFEPGEAVIRLPDATTGRVLVTHLNVSNAGTVGRFVGNGAEPS